MTPVLEEDAGVQASVSLGPFRLGTDRRADLVSGNSICPRFGRLLVDGRLVVFRATGQAQKAKARQGNAQSIGE